ncbi:hypothetical protein B0H16DRAFT_1453432 [Mycena metata]|uniref:Uncharacterized protein n=1 Tax=Mycena metata TaxID=1033252 RepID=A0AAD7JQ60_9AGAR|nr:hypothetical protein B0H16DRAFT_1453432 [Mycena metata]
MKKRWEKAPVRSGATRIVTMGLRQSVTLVTILRRVQWSCRVARKTPARKNEGLPIEHPGTPENNQDNKYTDVWVPMEEEDILQGVEAFIKVIWIQDEEIEVNFPKRDTVPRYLYELHQTL